jgi:RNA polymerase sigma-70 factor (ECF subfamily)
MADLKRLHSDDQEYFRILTEEHGTLVRSVCERHAVDLDNAEDLYQLVWTHVWRKRRSYNGHGSFEGWLYQVATNCCKSHHRSEVRGADGRSRFAAAHRDGSERWHPLDPAAEVMRRHTLRRIREAINALPGKQRTTFELLVDDELSAKEAATKMGVKQTTVRSLLRHAIKRLRILLADLDHEMPRRNTID